MSGTVRAILVKRAAVLLALAVPIAARAEPAWPQGLYGNVRLSQRTGDIGGLEVRFYSEGDRHKAEFTFCEGWCNDVHLSDVVREGDGFAFGYTEMFLDGGGAVPVKMRFVVRPAGDGLTYVAFQGAEALDMGGPSRLRRIAKPFGLVVARSGKD